MNPMERDHHAALFLLCIGFLLGGLTGHWLAEYFSAPEDIIVSFLQAVQEDFSIDNPILSEIWSVLRWPIFILILGFLPLTGLTIPLLFFLRGFLLSYLISGFGLIGIKGVLEAGCLLGPTVLLTIPVFFIVGMWVLLRQAQSEMPIPWLVIAICLGLLSLCIFLNTTAVPVILKKFLLHT